MVGFPLKRSSWNGTSEGISDAMNKKKKKYASNEEDIEQTVRIGTKDGNSDRHFLDDLIQKDLEKLNSGHTVPIKNEEVSKKKTSRWNLFMGKVGDENDTEMGDSHSDMEDKVSLNEQQSVQSTIEDTNSSTMIRTMSLGPSVTPFKIRDNLNQLLGIKPLEEKESFSEDISSQVSKIYDSLGRSSLSDLQVDHTGVNKFSGVPCTRLALINHSQNLAFLYQLNSVKRHLNDYLLYFKWCVWLMKVVHGERKTTIDRVIENNLDLRVFLKQIKKMIASKKYYKIHVFKFGITPSRKGKDQIGSETLEFRVPLDLQEELLKELLSIVLRDEIYRPESIQLPVCGLSFKQNTNYSVISLWLQQPRTNYDMDNVFNIQDILRLLSFLKDLIGEKFHPIIESVVLMNNKSLTTTKLFS